MGQPVIVTGTPEPDPSVAFAAGVAAATAVVAAETAEDAAETAADAAALAGTAVDAAAGAAGGTLDAHARIDALEDWIEDRLEDVVALLTTAVDEVTEDDGAPPVVEVQAEKVIVPEPEPTKKRKPRGFGSNAWFGNR